MGLNLASGHEMRLGVPAGVVGEALAQGRFADEPVERADEAGLVAVGDQEAGAVGREALADADDVVGDGGQAVELGLDEEIGERLALRGEHGEVGGEVERVGSGW